MTRAAGFGFAGFVATLAIARLASAEPSDQPAQKKKKELAAQPRVSSLELSGAFGPSYVFGEPANPEYTQQVTQVGAYGELGFAYRSSYFVDPFICGHDGTGVTRDIDVQSGAHLFVRVIRGRVFHHRDLIAKLDGMTNGGLVAGVSDESDEVVIGIDHQRCGERLVVGYGCQGLLPAH